MQEIFYSMPVISTKRISIWFVPTEQSYDLEVDIKNSLLRKCSIAARMFGPDHQVF